MLLAYATESSLARRRSTPSPPWRKRPWITQAVGLGCVVGAIPAPLRLLVPYDVYNLLLDLPELPSFRFYTPDHLQDLCADRHPVLLLCGTDDPGASGAGNVKPHDSLGRTMERLISSSGMMNS